MHFFGLEITGDHARLILPAMGGALALSGFVAGRWSRHRARVHFWREDLVASSIVIEMYGVVAQGDGGDMLHIITQGSPSSLEDFFLTPDLVRHVNREVVKHPGLLQLAHPLAHATLTQGAND